MTIGIELMAAGEASRHANRVCVRQNTWSADSLGNERLKREILTSYRNVRWFRARLFVIVSGEEDNLRGSLRIDGMTFPYDQNGSGRHIAFHLYGFYYNPRRTGPSNELFSMARFCCFFLLMGKELHCVQLFFDVRYIFTSYAHIVGQISYNVIIPHF